MIRKSLQDKIDYSVDLLRRSEEMALRLDPENGFHLAFSGGKDSQGTLLCGQVGWRAV